MSRLNRMIVIGMAVCLGVVAGAQSNLEARGSLDDGLIAYYPFSGSPADASGHGADGQVFGALLTADRFGQAERAYAFDGVDDYVYLPDVTHGLAEGSVALWFQPAEWEPGGPDGLYVWAGIAPGLYGEDRGDGINLGTHPYYAPDNALLFGIYKLNEDLSGQWFWANSGVTPQAGNWYCVAGVWGPSGLQLYVNGALAGTNDYSGPAPDYTSAARLGASTWPGTAFHGVADEVRLYDRALSAAEVQQLCAPVLTAPVDIKPGSYPNAINPGSHGKIPVAILSTDSFDATTVLVPSVRFGATGTEAPPVGAALEDVNADGRLDRLLHFQTQATGLACGVTQAVLTGQESGGQALEGSDTVRMVPCP